jgi:spermidine/putrescine transport system permease protein
MALLLPGTEGGNPAHKRSPGWGAWLLLSPLAAWLVLFVVVPTALLVIMSFCQKEPGSLGRIDFTFTLENFQRALRPTYLRILGASLWYAFLTTVICLIMGFPVAYFIGKAPERIRNILLLLVMIPFWTSFLIRTYAWISILSNQGFLNAFLKSAGIISEPLSLMYTPFAVVLGLVYNFLPFMILPIFGSVEKLDHSLVEAAYDLGARPVRAFSEVIIPLVKPGIIAGCFLVFVPAIAMFAITTLMGGGSNPTIGEVIQKQFGAAQNQPFGAALGTLLLLIFFAGLFVVRNREKDT